jgi:hypothetical protein
MSGLGPAKPIHRLSHRVESPVSLFTGGRAETRAAAACCVTCDVCSRGAFQRFFHRVYAG